MQVLCEAKEAEGLLSFMGKPVTIWCLNYIYTGKLVGINETCVKLTEASIVYETGAFNETGWKDSQKLPGDCHYVQISAIESFGSVK